MKKGSKAIVNNNARPDFPIDEVAVISGEERKRRFDLLPGLKLNRRGRPGRRVSVLGPQPAQVDYDKIALPVKRESVHASRRPAANEVPIRMIPGVVLRALEPSLIALPSQCGVLVRAGQRESVEHVSPPHDNYIIRRVD